MLEVCVCVYIADQKKEETMPSEGENSPEAENSNNNKKSKTGASQVQYVRIFQHKRSSVQDVILCG